jgi:hypothetical protein
VGEPILVFERDYDLVMFSDLAGAEAYLEPPEVPVLKAYDADGCVIRVATDGRSVSLHGTAERRPDELRAALVKTLAAVGVSAPSSTTLQGLVAEASPWFFVR